jgi:diacylglycerol kinase family enzyme
VLKSGKVVDIDLGDVDGIVLTNLVSVGISTRVPARLQRLIGRAAYPLTALAELPGINLSMPGCSSATPCIRCTLIR